ncbi:hypothetical protein MN869_15435 [Acinetobacter sp. NIPH1876]|uniref:hypothetical protein n=1 Tax=Acinetobacter sp. NIPH1876 TaxID=2924041 RepID=UPI001FADDE0D|nr:hypothetical protein [Acinetobacter sp. NIPH1876]MCJ0829837.1 hypothetical protein [Acinetobacter sp. NIPH1876]
MNIESLRQEFNDWHFLDWKLNCAVTETVEEARSLYERIYKPFHLDQISEREQCFKAWMAGRVFEAKKLEGCVVVPEDEYNEMAQYKDLYKRAIVNAKKRKDQLNWAHVVGLGVGSTKAVELLKELGIDPSATSMHAMVEAARGGNE